MADERIRLVEEIDTSPAISAQQQLTTAVNTSATQMAASTVAATNRMVVGHRQAHQAIMLAVLGMHSAGAEGEKLGKIMERMGERMVLGLMVWGPQGAMLAGFATLTGTLIPRLTAAMDAAFEATIPGVKHMNDAVAALERTEEHAAERFKKEAQETGKAITEIAKAAETANAKIGTTMFGGAGDVIARYRILRAEYDKTKQAFQSFSAAERGEPEAENMQRRQLWNVMQREELAKVATAQVGLENEKLGEQLELLQKRIELISAGGKHEDKYAESLVKIEEVDRAIASMQQTIAIARARENVGQSIEIDNLTSILRALQAKRELMQDILDKQKQLAAAQQSQQFFSSWGRSIDETVSGAFAHGIMTAIQAGDWKKALADALNSVAEDALRNAFKLAMSSLTGTGPGGAGPFEGLFKSIGSSATTTTPAPVPMAEGGYVPARTPRLAIIGEGPSGEYVIPERKLARMSGINLSVNVTIPGSAQPVETARQVAAIVPPMIRRELVRLHSETDLGRRLARQYRGRL